MVDATSTDRRWVLRLIAEERAAAALLLLAGAVGLLGARLLGAEGVAAALHPRIAGVVVDLPWLTADGLLVVFFFVAGLELRHEFVSGSLTTVRNAAVPVIAAMLGMAVPALIYIAIAPAGARDAWGVPMATDLPLALALVAVAGRGLPLRFRAFILSLAIVDDALSILVIAVVFGSSVSWPWILLTAALIAGYATAIKVSAPLAAALAVLAWVAMLQTGIHATVLGIALGLATSAHADRLRDRWQPVAGLVAVPLFVATSLAVPIASGDVDSRLITAIGIARIVGKPVGILLGAVFALRLFRPTGRLRLREYAVAGSVAGLGFSVSMLFAELGLDERLLPSTKLAILAAMCGAALVASLALLGLRRSATTE